MLQIRRNTTFSKLLFLAVAIAAAPFAGHSAPAQNAVGPDDAQIQAEVQKALDNKRYKDVRAAVSNAAVTLQGTVDLYADKEEAEKRVHRVKKVAAVEDRIEVSGAVVEDTTLRNKLAGKLATDRVGYGTTVFNSISLGVHNGVVTLVGTVYGPPDKDSALSLVANTPGVKDIVDNISVAPLSPMDDRLRLELARVIYASPQLQRYAINPAKPIRITVVNGNVTLTGVVDSKADSEVANIRANGVPGVFKVTDNLQVAGLQPGK